MPRYPIGRPRTEDIGQFDSLLEGLRGDFRRQRDPLAPPPEKEADPLIVPRALFNQAMSSEIMRQANALGIQQDAESLAFNSRVQGAREIASAAWEQFRSRPPPKPRHPAFSPVQIDGWLRAREDADARLEQALEEMRITNPGVAAPVFPINDVERFFPRGTPQRTVFDRQSPALQQAMLAGARPTVQSQMDGSTFLDEVFGLLGDAFNGKQATAWLVGNVVAGIETGLGLTGDFEQHRRQAEADATELIESNRVLELVVDEMSPGNLAILAATGGMSQLFAASGHRTLASAFALINRPVRVGSLVIPGETLIVARETSAIVLGRVGYEQTEGAPLAVRLAVGGVGVLVGANPEALISPTLRGVRAGARSINALGDDAAVRQIAPGAFEIGRGRFDTAPVVGLSGGAPERFVPGLRQPRPLDTEDILSSPSVLGHPLAPETLGVTDPAARGGARNATRFEDTTVIDRARDLSGQSNLPVPPGIMDAYTRGQALLTDVGNRLTRFLNQSTDFLHLRVAYVTEGAVQAEVAARFFPGREEILRKMETAFGGLDDAPNVNYIRPETTRLLHGVVVAVNDHPLTGKLVDVLENPSSYDLSDAQRALVERFDVRNTEVSAYVREVYGVNIGQFEGNLEQGGRRGSSFVPLDNKKAKVEKPSPQNAIGGRIREREQFNSISAAYESPLLTPDTFEPETNVKLLFNSLDDAKAIAAGRETFRHGIGGSLTNTGGLQKVDALDIWLPRAEAEAVAPLMEKAGNRFLDFVNIWRQTRLNADFSPMTIQGSLSFFADPLGAASEMWRILRSGDIRNELTRKFTARALADDVAKDPESWLDFSFFTGMAARSGTPEEFSTTLISTIPGFRRAGAQLTRANEAMFTAVMRSMKVQFDELAASAIRAGVNPNDAKAAAGDVVRMVVPIGNPRQLGLSGTRTALERAAFTSISFIRQPATFMKEAGTAYAKLLFRGGGELSGGGALANWSRLTPTERFAAQKFATMQGTIASITVMSAIATADSRNLSVRDAIERALDPTGGDFYKMWISPDLAIPLGGPIRSMFRAIAPREVEGVPIPFHGFIPFTNPDTSIAGAIPGFFDNRITPAAGSLLDLGANADFFQEEIVSGIAPMRALDALLFAGEQVLPLSIGTGLEGARRGLPFLEIVVEAFGGLLGTNPQFASESEQLERARRGAAAGFIGTDRVALQEAGLTEVQALAAEGFENIDELRKRIGTRAANAFMEAHSEEFPEALADYITELERRASRGDEIAKDLLIGAETQRDLDALAELMVTQVEGGESVNRIGYRKVRAGRMAEQRGAMSQSDLDQLKKSELEIDRLTGAFWDLYDLADDGAGGTDFDRFNTLERAFAAEHPELWPLVEANALTAPRGANQLEIDLRSDRGIVKQAGLWEIDDEAWEQFVAIVGEDVVGKAGNIRELVEQITAEIDVQQQADGLHSRATAELLASRDGLIEKYNKTHRILQAEWIADHSDELVTVTNDQGERVQMSIPAVALRQGYIANTEANILGAGELEETSSRKPDETLEMAQLFLGGLSFGQIAIKLGIEGEAPNRVVQSRLRRHFGESPIAVRERQAV